MKHLKTLSNTAQCVGADALLKLLSNYCRVGDQQVSIVVGVVGQLFIWFLISYYFVRPSFLNFYLSKFIFGFPSDFALFWLDFNSNDLSKLSL